MHRLRLALVALVTVIVAGTVGYVILGFSALDAVYQTVTTVSTVGFREVRPLSNAGKAFTIGLILVGVGTALYAFGVVLEVMVEGLLRQHLEARRMTRNISHMNQHVIICGWGRVGVACAAHLAGQGIDIVVVDRDANRLRNTSYPSVLGDISDDEVLRSAGIERARALIAALDTDADNVYVTLSARALRPDLVIIARARSEESTPKLRRAGADQVVNPQLIGGRRMAAFAVRAHVAEFLELVMHGESLDYEIEEVQIETSAPICGHRAGDLQTDGCVVLAVRPTPDGAFVPGPARDLSLAPGMVLIALGTPAQLVGLRALAHPGVDTRR